MPIAFERAIRGFKLSNEVAGRLPKTLIWYDRNLGQFVRWLERQGCSNNCLADLTPDLMRNYFASLRQEMPRYPGHPYKRLEVRALAPQTISGYYRSLSAFFTWLVYARGFVGVVAAG